MMIIDVKTLRVGVPMDFESFSLVTLPKSYGVTAPCPVKVSGKLSKSDTNTCVCEGEVTAKLRLECGRCLEAVECELSAGFHEEVGQKDDAVDISALVDENIILNIPQKVLCGEYCKGLCSVCGANLNISDCGCDQEGDPRFVTLRNLFQNKGGERDGNLS